eukprot:PhM_4_TR5988/c0_g1_i1/m.99442
MFILPRPITFVFVVISIFAVSFYGSYAQSDAGSPTPTPSSIVGTNSTNNSTNNVTFTPTPVPGPTTIPCEDMSRQNTTNASKCTTNTSCYYNATTRACATATVLGSGGIGAGESLTVDSVWCDGYFPTSAEVVLYLCNCLTFGFSFSGGAYVLRHRHTEVMSNKYGTALLGKRLPVFVQWIIILWMPLLAATSVIVALSYLVYWSTRTSCVHVGATYLYAALVGITLIFVSVVLIRKLSIYLVRRALERQRLKEEIQKVLKNDQNVLQKRKAVRCF